MGLVAVDVLLVTGAFLLVAHHIVEDSHRGRTRPSFYTGPVSLVEQPFRATHDNLRRIDVWAYVDGAPRQVPSSSREPVRGLSPHSRPTPVRGEPAEDLS